MEMTKGGRRASHVLRELKLAAPDDDEDANHDGKAGKDGEAADAKEVEHAFEDERLLFQLPLHAPAPRN